MNMVDKARRLLELAEQATMGPWKGFDLGPISDADTDDNAYVFIDNERGEVTTLANYMREADCRFVVAARNDAPEIARAYLELVEAVRKNTP